MRAIRRSSRTAMLAIAALALASAAAVPAAAAESGAAESAAAESGAADAAPPAGLPQAPHPGTSSGLGGVYCTSARNCMAVGFYQRNGAFVNEVLRWNGTKWAQMAGVPSPGGFATGATSELNAIRCTAPGNCWAVGFYERHSARAQALHWNGKQWKAIQVPQPGGILNGEITELMDVTCVSAANCWAVGRYGSVAPSQEFLNLVVHWTGKRWSLLAPPQPGGTSGGDISSLSGIKCSSAKSCLAVGTYGFNTSTTVLRNEALSWNGTKWSWIRVVPNPAGTGNGDQNGLTSLTCASPANCWAAGGAFTGPNPGTTRNEILHWNGRSWSTGTVANPDGTATGSVNSPAAVTCASAKSCVAVGEAGSFTGLGFIENESLRWTGHKWTADIVPEPAGTSNGDSNELTAIRCVNASDCWAVGSTDASGSTQRNEILHWNGTKWSAS